MPDLTCQISPSALVAMRDRLREAIHKPVVPLEMRRWLTREPVAFSERLRGEEAEVKVGDCWGDALFDCAWFRFATQIPPVVNGPLAVRIDVNGELLLVDHAGRPLRALTNVTSEFARCHGEPGKNEFALAPTLIANGKLELWGDAAFNDLFGGVQGDGRIVQAEVCEVREDIRSLYYDFEVLCDICEELSDDPALCDRIGGLLEEAIDTLREGFGPAPVAAARKILAPLFEPSEATDSLQVWAIGHAHLDLAWLWPVRETIRKGVRTFATALANRDLFPEHILGMSQPQLYAWMKQHDPEFYERIKQGVAGGAIEIQGRFWVEPDCNIPNGESLVRQVLHGARFYQDEFGFVPTECWQPDVFGYNGQLPQILAKSGHDVFMTQKLSWNMVNRFPHHSFHWEGIDGTSILTHMLPEETYNGPAAPRSLRKIRDEYAERDVSGHALMCFGIGDGGAGPGIEHLERLRRLKAFQSLPRVEIRKTPEFFAEWKKDASKFPRWRGELYLEKHQGTLTTQALAKKNNRRCEVALRELETVSVLAEVLAGHPYPKQELDAIWKEVLLFQFHDILPGSSIKRVYDESSARYAILLNDLETLVKTACDRLAEFFAEDQVSAAFNVLSQPRTDWVRHQGKWHRVTTPPLGFAELPSEPPDFGDALYSGPDLLENEFLRVRFAPDGTISSLFNKCTATEILPPGRAGNSLLVYPDKGDAWDFDADIPTKNVWRFMDEKPTAPTLQSSTPMMEGPNATIHQIYRIGKSTIKQRIQLQAGSDQLLFETEIDWQEAAHMLKVVFPTAIKADSARFEIPFGSLRRSTREDTPKTRAQFEVPGHQWIDLSEPGCGLALYNDSKYGFRVKNGQMEMTALRSVPHPSCAVITVDDTGTPGQSAIAEYGDLGAHSFRYAVQPHDGTLDEATLTARARALNTPLRLLPIGNEAIRSGSFFEIDHPAIEVTACKKAEQGDGIIVRLCNVSPSQAKTTIQSRLPFSQVWETDLLETRTVRCETEGNSLSTEFAPFEIKTLFFCC